MKKLIATLTGFYKGLGDDRDRLVLTIVDVLALIFVLVSFGGATWLRDLGGGMFLMSLFAGAAAFMRRYPAPIFGAPPLTFALQHSAWKTGVHMTYAGTEPSTALHLTLSYTDSAGGPQKVRIDQFHGPDDMQMIAAANPLPELRPGQEAYFELPLAVAGLDGDVEVIATYQGLYTWTKFRSHAVLSLGGGSTGGRRRGLLLAGK